MFTYGITVQVRDAYHRCIYRARTLAMCPAAYLGRGYRASSIEGISVHIRKPARSAVSSARRAPSRRGPAFRRVSARAVAPLAAVGGLAALSLAVPAAGVSAVTAVAQRPAAHAVPDVTGPVLKSAQFPAPQTIAQCQADLGINCYTPVQYRVAYDLNPLYAKGITGAGRTIVIVDSYGSPTIANDLHVFDQQFGFPDPTLVIDKFGNIPPFDPTNATEVGWAEETTLDVEYAHSIAPGAKIVLAETPVAETEGVTGLPEMMSAEKSLINQGVRRRDHPELRRHREHVPRLQQRRLLQPAQTCGMRSRTRRHTT